MCYILVITYGENRLMKQYAKKKRKKKKEKKKEISGYSYTFVLIRIFD